MSTNSKLRQYQSKKQQLNIKHTIPNSNKTLPKTETNQFLLFRTITVDNVARYWYDCNKTLNSQCTS